MIYFTISCDTLEDAMTLDQWDLFNAHIELAEKVVLPVDVWCLNADSSTHRHASS